MVHKIIHFFDKLEDRTRSRLSRSPILYAFLGGIGVILFWRGIWHAADNIDLSSLASIIVGTAILLITGVFVSAFIGNRLIISGIYGEKKLAEKTEDEIETEETKIQKLQSTLNRVEKKIDILESEIEK
ncbi:MAG TPA: hypothetical protein VJC13_01445 [Candidatus Paceibacterota bacterium]|nr:hypothetical protein [uncultured archaeon]